MVSGFDFPLHQSMDYCVFHWVLVFPFIIPILFLFQYDSNIFQCDSNKLFQYDSNKWFQGIIPIQLLGFPTSHAERSKESRRNLPTSARFVMKFLALAGSSDGEVPCLMSGINTMEVPKIWVYMGLYIYIWVYMGTITHTCSETSLRILLWSASLVHKTIPTKLTGKIGWLNENFSAKYASYVLAQREVLMQLNHSYLIESNSRLRQQCRKEMKIESTCRYLA